MKSLKILATAVAMGITFSSAASSSAVKTSTGSESNSNTKNLESKLSPEEAELLVSRLHEIRNIDMKLISMHEKKILRKEVRGINDELKKQDGVVFYLSGTAIIIIILLLILL